MDVRANTLAPNPIRIIPKTVDSHILERRISGQPFLWPEMRNGGCLAPCLPRAATKAIDENKINDGLGRSIEGVQPERTFYIIGVFAAATKRRPGRILARTESTYRSKTVGRGRIITFFPPIPSK